MPLSRRPRPAVVPVVPASHRVPDDAPRVWHARTTAVLLMGGALACGAWARTPEMPAVGMSAPTLALATTPASAVASSAAATSAIDASKEVAPTVTDCPAKVGEGTRCLAGRDSAGAFYLIAVPRRWNGDLVLHAHGGPFLGEPTAKRVAEDLERWSVMPRLGYAWAASSYRQGGVAVTAAAQDMERLRRLFLAHVGKPRHVFLHGQSWGASVAARGAETFTQGRPYDGVLLTAGVLGGGTRSYDFRIDLRAVYQYLCHNHPRPDEPPYPLNLGLPADSKMTPAELARRANECLGLDLPEGARTPAQAQRLKTLVDVIHVPERSIGTHLAWATFQFQDISARRTGGRSPFGNIGAVYRGSDDDAALNARVGRHAADPTAVATFGADADPGGRIPVPVLTVHAIEDPIAFVELQERFGRTMAAAGHADTLVQTYTDDRDHSYLSDPTYAALMEALSAWVTQGRKPTPQSVAAGCERARATLASTCRFRPDYAPRALETRVPERQRP